MTGNLGIEAARIAADVEVLAARTEPERPYTRRAFTPTFAEGRAYVEGAMRAAGLATRIDAAGNLIGRRPGRRPGLGTILLGSHSDTVPGGGRFDGVAGVAAALEVARALDGMALDHDLEIVDFLGEEVTIFGVSCVGSRGMAGLLGDWLDRRAEGRTLADAIGAVGGAPDRLAEARRDDVRAFLELHIEQGPVLEQAGLDIGVVTAIAGITRVEITVEGRADHAGTTPMHGRRDALVAAARIVTGVQVLGREHAAGRHHFAATVGECAIEPNAANIIPARARLLVDARAEHRPDMEAFCARLDALAAETAAEAEVGVTASRVSDAHPVPCDPGIVATLDGACDAVGARHRRMASGAGHDTAWMARIARAGLIFVPCREGRSHAPEEFAETGDIALGAAVLAEAVRRLDRTLPQES
jgi:beta-ureidopropionase / N-carbamoyl-L-amino-acid hydrolase